MMKPYRDIQKIAEPIIQLRKDLNKALEPLREFQKVLQSDKPDICFNSKI